MTFRLLGGLASSVVTQLKHYKQKLCCADISAFNCWDATTLTFGERTKLLMDRDRAHGWRPLVSPSNPSTRYFGRHMPYLARGMQGLAERQMHCNFPADLVHFKETGSANRDSPVPNPSPKKLKWPPSS